LGLISRLAIPARRQKPHTFSLRAIEAFPGCSACDLTGECSIHADLRQEHRFPILSGVGQRLSGKPPFGGITLHCGEAFDKVIGFSQSSGRFSSE